MKKVNVQWTIEHTTVETNLFGFVMYLTLYKEVFYQRPLLCIYRVIKHKLKTKMAPLTKALLA